MSKLIARQRDNFVWVNAAWSGWVDRYNFRPQIVDLTNKPKNQNFMTHRADLHVDHKKEKGFF